MFSLHETKRKHICRWAFLALCLAPTLATLTWIAQWLRPWREAAWGKELGRRLHVDATVADTSWPQPKLTLCGAITFSELQRAFPLLEINEAQWRRLGGARLLSARRAQINAASISQLAARIADWMASDPTALDLNFDEMIVQFEPSDKAPDLAHEYRLLRLQGRCAKSADGANGQQRKLLLRAFVKADGGGEAPIMLSAERSRHDGDAAFRIKIDCREAAMPTVLVCQATKLLRSLRGSSFRGQIQLDVDSQAVHGSLQGVFERVDLAAALPSGSPHEIRAEATLNVQRLDWRNDRIERVDGSLHAIDVAVSRSVFLAAEELLRCRMTTTELGGPTTAPNWPPSRSPTLVPLDELSCRFAFDVKGLTMWGECAGVDTPKGCMATRDRIALLMQPTSTELPAGLWIRFLLPWANSWSPATREAIDVANRLPLPKTPQVK